MKNAFIVRGSGGLGIILIDALKNDGFNVISITRNECDLTNYKQIKESLLKIKKDFKSIDLLVNAAGIATYKNLTEVSDEDLQNSFMVNTIAPAIFIRELTPLMNNKDSLVLNIGSGAGTMPMKGRSIYCATKYALRGLTLSLAEEYEGRNPKFCLITLGSTLTNFGPMTIEVKKREFKKGKAYFPVEFVVGKLIGIIKNDKREKEITLFPGDHGFGTWKKP